MTSILTPSLVSIGANARASSISIRARWTIDKRAHAHHASNDTHDRTFAEVLAQLATQRGTVENVKDENGPA